MSQNAQDKCSVYETYEIEDAKDVVPRRSLQSCSLSTPLLCCARTDARTALMLYLRLFNHSPTSYRPYCTMVKEVG